VYNWILINSNIPSVGPTSAQSKTNFKTWINNEATWAAGVIVQGLNGLIEIEKPNSFWIHFYWT